ncbi:capsular polysaccharide ABC transporter ATP-binding protein KpsT [Vibrio variabilis]|uniref:Capsular polysaccharide ABC transporter ATP-binding protein KpsT n=1 Tax=Vibrio variabilis TaxID=990271 RepID=A0ABQ0J7N0_9VIBR|nr:capsular polysaccharide ABC transporter ATP-binding protein KpsT [Vibrio variabilis]
MADLDEYEEKVKSFAELGVKYDLPVRSYSSGMRARLAFGCCIAIDFDIYLIDEATSVGDQKFKKKAKQALLDKAKTANVIMVSHDIPEIKQFCDSVVIIHDGQLTYYEDLEQGLEVYKKL